MAAEPKTDKKRRGIQSVEIGLRVLAAVAAHRTPSSLSMIAQGSGLSPSQAHRYLSSLIASQMVRQVPGSSLYDLEAGAIRIGLAALLRLNVLSTADEVFARYARTSGRTTLIAIWGDAGPTIIRWFDGDPAVHTSLGLGSVLPLFQSATGRVFYAFGNEAEMDRFGAESAKRVGRQPDEFVHLRTSVRSSLYSSIEGDLIPGLRATASPIFDLQGRLVLVAAELGSSVQTKISDSEARGGLLDACKQLTESIGGVWPASNLPAKAPKRTGARR